MGLMTMFGARNVTRRRRLPAETLTDLSSAELHDHLMSVLELTEGDTEALYYARTVLNYLIFRRTQAVEIGNGRINQGDGRPPRRDGDDRNIDKNSNSNNDRRHRR